MRRAVAAAVVVAWLSAVPAFAANRQWTGRVNANWSEALNWSPNGVPSATEDGNDVVLTAGAPAKTWIGTNSDKWSDAANWDPFIVPVAGEPLLFPAGSRLTTTNDLPAGFNVGPMTFNADYILGGNPLTLTGDLTFAYGGSSIIRFTCNAPLKLANSVRFKPAIQTTFNGPIDINGNTLTIDTVDTTFNGAINGDGTIDAYGSGISLNANGTFHGPITGIVNVTASYPSATIYASRLSGTGTTGEVMSGTLTPGSWRPSNSAPSHAVATLRTGSLSIMMGLAADLNPGGTSDQVKVTGGVSLAGTLQLTFFRAPSPGQSFTLIDNDGIDGVSGIFDNLPEGSEISTGYGSKLRLTYKGGAGNDVVLGQSCSTTTKTATTTTLAQNRATTEMHQPVTFTATVTATSGVAAGSVTFFDGSSSLGSSTLQNAIATLTTKILTLGAHTITASYAGNDTFEGSTSVPLTHTVVKGHPNITSTTSPSRPTYGESVMFSISVAAGDASVSDLPTGTVTLSVDGTAVKTAALNASGNVTNTVSLMNAGPHAIEVAYSGDAVFNAGTASMTQIVARAPTLVSVDSSANPAPPGAPVVLSVRVTTPGRSAPPADGMVMVSKGSTMMSQQHLSAAAVSVRLENMPAGTHELTTAYTGNENFEASAVKLMQVVGTLPSMSMESASFIEGTESHDEVISVRLSSVAAHAVLVNYRTADRTAIAGLDYAAVQGTLFFAPGQTTQTIAVRILGDTKIEGDETFTIELSSPTGATLVTTSATVTIVNDDVPGRRRAVPH